MKLLAVETSSQVCGVCIYEGHSFIDKIEIENGLTHSQNLMPLIQNLLNKNNLKINDINYFVCDIGPGSFTGIRIGVATVKAFVDVLDYAKYTGVSSLEALAYNYCEKGLICSIIDAKNDNCYFALYNSDNSNYLELIPPTAATINELFNYISKYENDNIVFVGDGAIVYKQEIENNIKNTVFVPDDLNTINTSNIALAGLKKFENDNTLELTPLYLKKPQAQRQLEEKLKKD